MKNKKSGILLTPEVLVGLYNFSQINKARCEGPFNCGDKGNLYWATALAEETGEIAGVIKKMDRGFNAREYEKMKREWLKTNTNPEDLPSMAEFKAAWVIKMTQALANEIADVFIYLELFAQRNGINIFEAVTEKFNQVSNEMKCPQFKI